MITKKLYKYIRPDGGITVSPVIPTQDTDFVIANMTRLIADEGKAITNGIDIATCIDIENRYILDWEDCELPSEPEELSEE